MNIKEQAKARGVESLAIILANDELELSTETRKITLVEFSQEDRLEIEWFGNDHRHEITRVTYRVGYEDLEESEELNISEGSALWNFADFVVKVSA